MNRLCVCLFLCTLPDMVLGAPVDIHVVVVQGPTMQMPADMDPDEVAHDLHIALPDIELPTPDMGQTRSISDE